MAGACGEGGCPQQDSWEEERSRAGARALQSHTCSDLISSKYAVVPQDVIAHGPLGYSYLDLSKSQMGRTETLCVYL